MQRILIALAVVALATQLQACTGAKGINPFAPKPLSNTEVAQSRFAYIFVPSGMELQGQYSQVMQGGIAYGVQCWTGNYALAELGSFMQNLLKREGWKLRLSLMHGDRAVQEYERQGVRAVLRYVRQSMTTALEIWVGNANTLMRWPLASSAGSAAHSREDVAAHENHGLSSAPVKSDKNAGKGAAASSGLREHTLP